LEKKGKQFWIKKRKTKEGKLKKKMIKYKKKKEKALWITVVIHSNLGVGKQ
jgi:hypothetical protein